MSTLKTVLITGATSGIGLGLASRFHARGDRVVVTGRSENGLQRVRAELPGVLTIAGDLADSSARTELAEHIENELGELDILINNAGIQRRVEIARDVADWEERRYEIDLLIGAPIHLASLLAPILIRGSNGQIVNVTSGGAFQPQPFAPAYSAAKAALHSYTVNLRYALAETKVRVTELIPPAVATGLAGPSNAHGADLDEFCDAAFAGIVSNAEVVGFGPTASQEFGERLSQERERFLASVERFPIEGYHV